MVPRRVGLFSAFGQALLQSAILVFVVRVEQAMFNGTPPGSISLANGVPSIPQHSPIVSLISEMQDSPGQLPFWVHLNRREWRAHCHHIEEKVRSWKHFSALGELWSVNLESDDVRKIVPEEAARARIHPRVGGVVDSGVLIYLQHRQCFAEPIIFGVLYDAQAVDP